MESNYPSTIDYADLKPSMEEFVNFKSYIKKVEGMNICFAKVTPPQEWRKEYKSKVLSDDFELSYVVNQKSARLSGDVWHFEQEKLCVMNLSNFKNLTKNKTLKNKNIREIENEFWKTIDQTKMYSLNNEVSLFNDELKSWNLNKFTNMHSNIHGTTIHDKLSKVSKLYFNLCAIA